MCLNHLLQKDLNAGLLTHFWAHSIEAERQRSTTGETITTHLLQQFLKESTHFSLTSEGRGSCSYLQRLHQVPLCLSGVPARCRAQVDVWGRGFLVLTFWNFTCRVSIATPFFFVQSNSSQHCRQPLSVLWILSGKREKFCVLLSSFSALSSPVPVWPDILNHKGHTFCHLREPFQSQKVIKINGNRVYLCANDFFTEQKTAPNLFLPYILFIT